MFTNPKLIDPLQSGLMKENNARTNRLRSGQKPQAALCDYVRPCHVEEKATLTVENRELQVSHLDKVLFPRTGFLKAQVIDYYIKMSELVLPHIKDRPLTLKMYTQDVRHPAQYIKDAPSHTPSWIKTAEMWRLSGESTIHFILLNDLPSLVWAANLNNIELHTFLARAPKLSQPTVMLLDLDPGEPAAFLDCAEVALELKALLDALDLESFIKSSGSKGLHVMVPLNMKVTYDQTQAFARELALSLQASFPDRVVVAMSKSHRRGKVFVDYSQNMAHKSTASVYSLRAHEDGPFVSIPLSWPEIRGAVERQDATPFLVRPEEALARARKHGDMFAPVLKLKQKLPGTEAVKKKKQIVRTGAAAVRAAAPAALKKYRAKRDFQITSEPAGGRAPGKNKERERMFVIQKHAASHLHYDFRLEMEGVLRSWAVPKGPPLMKGDRRLAMLVEDHPIEYGGFEGIIPAGQYGGGIVMLWDMGTYTVKDGNPVKGFYSGKLHLIMKGKKLKGEWALVRRSRSDPEERSAKQAWFLIKIGEDARPISARRDNQSVKTGRTMEQIARDRAAEWASNR
jgi:bifunctional non-homologous end joining protein LigD